MMSIDILNLGLGANVLELFHHRLFVKPFKKNLLLRAIDIPQHLVAAAIASNIFNPPVAALIFVGLPLTFKAVELCTQQRSTLNQLARAGDHIMRLASKVVLIVASFAFMYTSPNPLLPIEGLWAVIRGYILVGSFIKDVETTFSYTISGMDNFEEAISQSN